FAGPDTVPIALATFRVEIEVLARLDHGVRSTVCCPSRALQPPILRAPGCIPFHAFHNRSANMLLTNSCPWLNRRTRFSQGGRGRNSPKHRHAARRVVEHPEGGC